MNYKLERGLGFGLGFVYYQQELIIRIGPFKFWWYRDLSRL